MHTNAKTSKPSSKIYVSHGILPDYIDPKQPPSKKQPFGTILNQHFNHTVELILPEALYDLIWSDVAAKLEEAKYERVIMALPALLEGEFFNQYIKSGNILMLSEGRPGVGNVYSLHDGLLRLELPKEVYERTGLTGRAIGDAGRKHVKTRYVIEIGLRQPSMLHGRKGFDRIEWACKNVLNKPVSWLFYQLGGEPHSSSENPLAKHHPVIKKISPEIRKSEAVLVPSLPSMESLKLEYDVEHWALNIYEWLGLVSLHSPRILQKDSVDSYLSRYRVAQDQTNVAATNLLVLSWKAFVPSVWVRTLLQTVTNAAHHASADPHFFAVSAYAMETSLEQQYNCYTIMALERAVEHKLAATEGNGSNPMQVPARPGRHFIMWKNRSS